MEKNINFKKQDIVYIVKLGLLFSLYFFTAKAGLKFDAVSGFATFVWPPTGIALAAIFLFGYRLWPAIFLGAFLVNFTTGAPVLVALGIALGNTLEAVVGVFLLRKFGFTGSQKKLKDVLLFIVFGAMLNTIIAAIIGTLSLWLGGLISSGAIIKTWVAWYIGDVLGALVVGNLIIACAYEFPPKSFKILKILEGVALLGLVTAFNIAVFSGFFTDLFGQPNTYVLAYLIFLFLLWASIRFSPSISAVVVFSTFVIATWGTAVASGIFAAPVLSTRLFMLQGYTSIISVTGMVLAAVISERFMVEEELRTEKNKDEAILESVGEGVIVINTKGIILLINHAAELMLHVDSGDVVGSNYEEIVRIETVKGTPILSHLRPFSTVVKSNKVITDTYYFVRSDGTKFPVVLTTAPIIFENKIVGAIDVFRDITHEMDIDKAKSEFVLLASHQLRTPLTTMKWYSHTLLGKDIGNLSKKQKEYVREIYHSNHRMIELVNALLNVSRIELGTFIIKPIPCKLENIIEEIIHDFKLEAQNRKISIELDHPKDLPTVKADPDLLRIVVGNLLSNSLKYSKTNTSVSVNIQKKEREIIISVGDTGCGIPKSEHDKIFRKLFRSENAKSIDPEGNGLGLYIVKSILDTAGCRIWFTSEIDEGSTFYVALPIQGMKGRETGSRLIIHK